MSDTPQERARVKRDLAEVLRQAEQYLGPQEIDQLVRDHRMARRGNKPKTALNKLVLDEWDADPVQDPKEFAEAFFKKYPQSHSAGAVRKRLERGLKAREKARDRERWLKERLQRPSLVGEAGRTK